MKIGDSKGIRIHAALTKHGKGQQTITWKLNYKDESVWCNNYDDLIRWIKVVSMVQLFGDDYKTFRVGKDGWQKNTGR